MSDLELEFPYVDAEVLSDLLASRRKLTDNQLAQLLRRITPMRVVRDKLYPVAPLIYRMNGFSFVRGPSRADKMAAARVIAHISTLHSIKHTGRFEPTVPEVLCMIPVELLPSVVAFQTLGPAGSYDINRQRAAIERGYYVAVTVLYGR